ncbi:helix-turn-helix transcriptional regulator [Streptomyces griseus]|uniref:helix-turn-helix transcriptional regulator n=1 Tax=Streptomyces griseus TaxID=1911 RepID=UPI00056CE146|nr:helix-turn-helix transcriptional regulator [Streptomyces griseus]
MARGTANFDGEALRTARLTRPVDGRLLSAEAVAQRLGTSKSRILAYENNTSKPDPKRIAQISDLFGIPARELRTKRALADIHGLRCQSGLTAAEAAALVGISRSGYANIERHALLPVRDDGTVRMNLARVFGVTPAVIDRALLRHPAAVARQVELAERLGVVFERAHHKHSPAVIDVDDPLLRQIAPLLQRPAKVACRLVNAELDTYRELLRDHARMKVDEAFAQTASAATRARNRRTHLETLIEGAAPAAAKNLSRFLSEAMNVRQWRLMVALANTGLDGLAFSSTSRYASQEDLTVLQIRQYATVLQRGDQTYAIPTENGLITVRNNYARYGRLYPRVPAPNLSHYWEQRRRPTIVMRRAGRPAQEST